MDVESKNKSVLWDYYQVLVKTHGFNGITDLITKFHALESENARLRAEIDAANAQQVPDAIKLLQRVAASTSDSIAAQQSQAATSDKVLFNGSHGHAGYVIEEQQSPAVAVPVGYTAVNTSDLRWLLGDFGTFNCHLNLNSWRKKLRDSILPSAESPRITEQDARDIVDHYRGHAYENGFLSETAFKWLEAGGRALLNKLNGVHHE